MKLDQHSLLEGTKLVVLISYLPPTLVNRLRLPVAAGRSKASSAGGARKLGQRPRQASCRAKGHGINSLNHLLGRGWGALVEEEVGGPTPRGRRGAAAA